MKNKTNIFKKFINSIYNVDEFPKYIRDGVGKALLYALVLSLFVGAIKGIFETVTLSNYINQAVDIIDNDNNQFIIDKNKLMLENSPIKIEDRGTLFYADDTVDINDVSKLRSMIVNEDLSFLILKDGLYIKKNVNDTKESENNMKVYYTDLNLAEQINNVDIINIIKSAESELYFGNIVFYMAREFFMYIISSFIIALLTIIPGRLWGINFKLSSLFSLVIYAYTLPILLVLILSILIPNIIFDTAGMVGAIVYTYLAIRSIKRAFSEKVV